MKGKIPPHRSTGDSKMKKFDTININAMKNPSPCVMWGLHIINRIQ